VLSTARTGEVNAEAGMDVAEAVRRRRSVRAFLPDPVPGEVVRALVEAAGRAPSGGNLQPWRVHAVGGSALAELRAILAERIPQNPRGEPPEYDVYPKALWEPYRTRRHGVGEAMYGALGVGREDKASRLAWFARNYDFFGAPVALFFSVDRRMGPPQWADLGMYLQTLMLLAVERGLDTCAQEAWSAWPQTIGAFLGLDADHMLFCGMALGRRDPEATINRFPVPREPFEAFAEMRGFDQEA
jgi:nitroreductase